MTASRQTVAKNTAAALMREARAAGWARARFEIKPDGSVIVDAGMVDQDSDDNFLASDLRMGK
ncbi:hypothetical protein [Tropicimonas isoalkanivorans]|uniref:Uncharacterized protein n=1 Tax=Tropicimonas isoalkanivorans TaxID=441112 RepID=A0A1I1E4M2_9RHOB|nr:hypothetical protein [Tropicimonas isoalkanivorans]SFB82027.1 hypothetical protein SAMN04488094_101633 [Tropicimonas isoalkanivorans]